MNDARSVIQEALEWVQLIVNHSNPFLHTLILATCFAIPHLTPNLWRIKWCNVFPNLGIPWPNLTIPLNQTKQRKPTTKKHQELESETSTSNPRNPHWSRWRNCKSYLFREIKGHILLEPGMVHGQVIAASTEWWVKAPSCRLKWAF